MVATEPEAPRLFLAARHEPLPAWSGEQHRHDLHEVVYVARGRYQVEVAGQRLQGRPGDCFSYAPGLVHVPEFSAGSELYLLQWDERDTAAARAWPVQRRDAGGRIGGILAWLVDLHPAGSREHAGAIGHLLALLRFALGQRQDGIGDPAVEAAIAHMQANLARPLHLAELAGIAGCSRFHLARAFAAATGMAPMRYLRRLRTDAACRLIVTTGMPLAEIAKQVGFANAFHLSRVVARTAGAPPIALRGGRRAGRARVG